MKSLQAVLWLIMGICAVYGVVHRHAFAMSPVVAPDARLERLAGGFGWAEGATADRAGNVFFSDQPNNRILEWSVDGRLSTFLQPAGRAMGMNFDPRGNLIACADEHTELWSIAPDGTHSVLTGTYGDKHLNGPNDVWVRGDGGAYITDPFDKRAYWDYDRSPQGTQQVYFLPAGHAALQRVTDDLEMPNGIVGTPDGRTLYVSDIQAGKTYAYDVRADGSLANKRLRCNMGSDGMTLDVRGNLYLSGLGITVCDPGGRRIEHIDVPEPWTGNLSFGGADHRTLFVAATTGFYSIRMRYPGANAAK
jgi:gluconolactonase